MLTVAGKRARQRGRGREGKGSQIKIHCSKSTITTSLGGVLG